MSVIIHSQDDYERKRLKKKHKHRKHKHNHDESRTKHKHKHHKKHHKKHKRHRDSEQGLSVTEPSTSVPQTHAEEAIEDDDDNDDDDKSKDVRTHITLVYYKLIILLEYQTII